MHWGGCNNNHYRLESPYNLKNKGDKMKTSKESLEWYRRSNAIWEENGFPIRFTSSKHEKVDFNTVKRVVRSFWKLETGRKIPYDIREGSGNRNNWVSWQKRVLTINTERGWANIVHEIGHLLGYAKKLPRPHCAEHATLEWRFTKYVFDGNYIEKSRDCINTPTLPKPKKDVVLERYEKMIKRKKAWETKLLRSKNAYAKVCKEVKRYESVHEGRINKGEK